MNLSRVSLWTIVSALSLSFSGYVLANEAGLSGGISDAFFRLFVGDPHFAEELVRLIVFTASALLGMLCHWYKKWYRKETSNGFMTYFFAASVKNTVFAFISVLVCVATAWVIGLVQASSVISLIFQGLLIGFTSNSVFNQDSARTIQNIADKAMAELRKDDGPEEQASKECKAIQDLPKEEKTP